MKRELGALIIGTALLEGCASTPTPTPKPELLVDCQKGPFDAIKQYELREGEEIVIGGFTRQGQNDLIIVKPTGPGQFDPIPRYVSSSTPNGITLTDENLYIILDSKKVGSTYGIGASITCNEKNPPTPSPFVAKLLK